MIAVKLYGENPRGIPAAWPEEVRLDVDALPSGFDFLLGSIVELEAYKTLHQSAYDAWLASQQDQLPVPESITKYQATRWLRDMGLYDALMQAMDTDAKDRWFLSPVLLRSDPIVEGLGLQLGLTTEQLDGAFTQASQIQ